MEQGAGAPLPVGGEWVRRQAVGVIAALQFLTLVPPLVTRMFTSAEMGAAVGYFPLVGLALGAALAGLQWLLGLVFPGGVTTVLLLIAWVGVTGALHLDGFLDACDGLLGGHTPESRLTIMRDERVGAFALAGGALLILLKYASLAYLVGWGGPWWLAPALGRWAMSAAVVGFPYGRPSGVGRTLKDHAGWPQLAIATAIVLLAGLLGAGWRGVAVLPVAALVVWGGARFTMQRIPGLTGDIYGALCELTEAVTLAAFVALHGRWV